MRTPLAIVEKVIRMHGLNTLAVYDTGERLRLFFVEGSSDEICEHLNEIARAVDGTILVKAWKRTPKQSGRRPEAESTYSWHVAANGRESAEAVGTIGAPAGLSPDLMLELATLRAKEAMKAEPEADYEPEPLDRLVDMLAGMLTKPAAPVERAEPLSSPVELGHSSALSRERMAAILSAIKRLHDSDPDTFRTYEGYLLSNYGKPRSA